MKKLNMYKEFEIKPDRLLGYSIFDSRGNWCCSEITEQKCKKVIDKITEINALAEPEQKINN